MVKNSQREYVGWMGQETDSFFLVQDLWCQVTRGTAFLEQDILLTHPIW